MQQKWSVTTLRVDGCGRKGAKEITFDDFVKLNLPALGRYAGVLTGDRYLAEDVLSDALIATAARWESIGQMEYPLAYVRRVVASTYLADRRRHHRRQTEPAADPAGAVVRPDDPHGRLADRDELDRLLSSLPRHQQVAVVMRFYLDLPDTDIAEALGCSPGTVRSTIFRALSALRTAQTAGKE